MIHFTERLDKAIRIAARSHAQQGQHRKGSDTPYIIHPFGTMLIASQATDDEDTLIACLLHDVIEDVHPEIYSKVDMSRDFGDKVLGIVMDVTKDDTMTDWHESAQAYLHHLINEASDEAVIVSTSDKIHNITSIITDYKVKGNELWQIFSTKSADDQLWFYEAVLKAVQGRGVSTLLSSQLESRIGELKTLIVPVSA